MAIRVRMVSFVVSVPVRKILIHPTQALELSLYKVSFW